MIREGYVTSFMAKGKRIHGVVVHIRRKRGGGYEIIIAPLHGAPPKVYQYTFQHEALLKPPTMRFTEDEILAARGKTATTHVAVLRKKQARTEANQKALGEPDWASRRRTGVVQTDKLAIGDRVLINYRDGKRWEEVAAINIATGKVAILRGEGGAEYRAKERAKIVHLKAAVAYHGLPGAERINRKRGPSEVRWLPATLVVEVEERPGA